MYFSKILNVSGIWSLFLNARKIFCFKEKLPVCGCAQSHMYKVAYVLPLISELFIHVCVCVCVLIVVSMVMRWDTTSRRRGGSLLLNSINLVVFEFASAIITGCYTRQGILPGEWKLCTVSAALKCIQWPGVIIYCKRFGPFGKSAYKNQVLLLLLLLSGTEWVVHPDHYCVGALCIIAAVHDQGEKLWPIAACFGVKYHCKINYSVVALKFSYLS